MTFLISFMSHSNCSFSDFACSNCSIVGFTRSAASACSSRDWSSLRSSMGLHQHSVIVSACCSASCSCSVRAAILDFCRSQTPCNCSKSSIAFSPVGLFIVNHQWWPCGCLAYLNGIAQLLFQPFIFCLEIYPVCSQPRCLIVLSGR